MLVTLSGPFLLLLVPCPLKIGSERMMTGRVLARHFARMSIGVIILLCFVRSTVAASSAPLPPTDLGRLSLLMRSEMEKVKEKVCQTCMTGCMDPGVTMKKIVVPNSVVS